MANKSFQYDNNAVFAGIMIIYGPRFFIYNEKLRARNSHNDQIKQRYYYYNSFKRCCVFLRVLCFALFNQIVQILVTKLLRLRILIQGKGDLRIKRHFYVLISHSYFFCVLNSMFLSLSFVCVFSLQQTKRIR